MILLLCVLLNKIQHADYIPNNGCSFGIILLRPLGFQYFGEFFFISKYSDNTVYVLYNRMLIIQNLHQFRQVFRVTVASPQREPDSSISVQVTKAP